MPLFTRCDISLWCPQNLSDKFQLKILHRSFIIFFWKCLFWVETETGCFRACLFKCKWAAAPRPRFQNRDVPSQLVSSDGSTDHFTDSVIWISFIKINESCFESFCSFQQNIIKMLIAKFTKTSTFTILWIRKTTLMQPRPNYDKQKRWIHCLVC